VNFVENSSETDVEKLLIEAVTYANESVCKDGNYNPLHKGMGTTLVVCVIKDDELYVANVGDSRLYIYSGALEQITVDHSVVEELFRAGHISKEDRHHHPDKNMITRAIGAEHKVAIDHFIVKLSQPSRILLCSDGLNKMLEDFEVEQILRSGESLKAMCQKMVSDSLDRGGRDNITIIAIDYGKEVLS
jgi:protein phosphatase